MKIFFNSSMPRSGSTLLQNILGNNPEIYATPTSGIAELILHSKKVYTNSPNFKAQDAKEMKSAFLYFCRYGLEGYFTGLTDKPYVVDKSRSWAVNMPFLERFYDNPKMICMVRDLRDITASMEKNYRKHPEKSTFKDFGGQTIGERVTIWLSNTPVGSSLKALREVIQKGDDKKILFIRFEDLCNNPEVEMKKVYKYLGLPYLKMDYNNIQQVTHEDDKFHGIYGDHKIQQKIVPLQSKHIELLGKELSDNIYDKNRWYFDYFKYKK
jgi:sulfotransferase